MAFKITLSDSSDLEKGSLAIFEGDFDGAAKESLIELEALIGSFLEGRVMVFDFTQLDYLNSFAVSKLIEWNKTLQSKNAELVLVGLNDNLNDILTVLGVEGMFKIYSDLTQFIANMPQ